MESKNGGDLDRSATAALVLANCTTKVFLAPAPGTQVDVAGYAALRLSAAG